LPRAADNGKPARKQLPQTRCIKANQRDNYATTQGDNAIGKRSSGSNPIPIGNAKRPQKHQQQSKPNKQIETGSGKRTRSAEHPQAISLIPRSRLG
jgi:hypothetical protein